jgi:hypothetical protein
MALLAAAVSTVSVSTVTVSTARATLQFSFSGNYATLSPTIQAAFQTAASRWTNSLNVLGSNGQPTNMTVTIALDYAPLAFPDIGVTQPSAVNTPYSSFVSALSARSTSADDATAIANLPSGTSLSAYINHTTENGNSSTPYIANGVGIGTGTATSIELNRATAKALGFNVGTLPTSPVDANMTLSSTLTYDFDPSNGIDSGALDFVGVVTHELGHALGFSSVVDAVDGYSTAGALSQNVFTPQAIDLFRYSALSTSSGIFDLSADTRNKYFSINKGATNLANFSTGVVNGDGAQASHWQHSSNPIGILDPDDTPGQTMFISPLDREAFDVMGFSKITTWSWTDATSSSTAYWANAARWNTDGVPDSTISAVFAMNTAAPYTVAINTNSSAKDITIGNDSVTFNLTNSNLTSGAVNLGQTAGNVATVTVQKFTAGQFNTGNLTVGAVASTTGHLNIQSGGIVSTTGALAVAPVATSVGTVTIGAGTLSTTGDASIGGTSSAAGGAGSLAVNSGGTMNVGGNFRVWGTAGTGATVAGGTLAVNGGTTVASGALLAQSSGAFTSNGLTLNGSFNQSGGNVAVGAITGAGSATVSGGTLNANSLTIAGLIASGTGHVLLKSNGTNSGTSRVSSLSITGNGQVDLNDNDLILDYSGASPLLTIRGYIASGFSAGNWNGVGLASTAGHANAAMTTALGYAEANSLGVSVFDNQSVDTTTLLVKYTYYGDNNLDGKVDTTDFQDFLNGYALNGSTWFQGDYTYDGKVDLGNDFDLFLSSYRNQNGSLGALDDVIEASPALSISQRASLLSIVPEPSTVALGITLGCALLARRRRV